MVQRSFGHIGRGTPGHTQRNLREIPTKETSRRSVLETEKNRSARNRYAKYILLANINYLTILIDIEVNESNINKLPFLLLNNPRCLSTSASGFLHSLH